MNEKFRSFVWLFKTLLKSMNVKHPITMMTGQVFSMTATIKEEFLLTHHRLYCSHTIESSRENIRVLVSTEAFTKIFNSVLMEGVFSNDSCLGKNSCLGGF